jgi:hypothetical protein
MGMGMGADISIGMCFKKKGGSVVEARGEWDGGESYLCHGILYVLLIGHRELGGSVYSGGWRNHQLEGDEERWRNR